MKYLFVVDVQREFAKKNKETYDKCIDYIEQAGNSGEYDEIIAVMYKASDEFINMKRLVEWDMLHEVEPLDFIPDRVFYLCGYSVMQYPILNRNDEVDIIGADTDACVLSACFHLFDIGCNMRILTDYLWSSGGEEMHEAGLKIMRRQFGKAVV